MMTSETEAELMRKVTEMHTVLFKNGLMKRIGMLEEGQDVKQHEEAYHGTERQRRTSTLDILGRFAQWAVLAVALGVAVFK